MSKKWLLLPVLLLLLIGALSVPLVQAKQVNDGQELSPIEELGKEIFFDLSLSINGDQSCASCHGPEAGWTGPLSDTNDSTAVYEGSIPGAFGNRKPPSAAYATLSPIFYLDKHGLFIGGNFWDGRATGELLGNPAADQARGPFLNPVEQALPDSECVVYQVVVFREGYDGLFFEVWGEDTLNVEWPDNINDFSSMGGEFDLSPEDRAISNEAYDQIALSIAAYEASFEVNAFTSKYDYAKMGLAKLTKEERLGFALFNGKAKCSKCHTSTGQYALFTDFTFDNLGIPQNPQNPAGTSPDFIDYGLGGFLEDASYPEDVYEAELGKFKVPTLRNVDLRPDEEFVKAYGHNGYFTSLEEIVHFYNTRDVEGAEWEGMPWPEPEVSENVNTDELGDLGLTPEEEAAIVAFLKTLSDGYTP